ncbi:MAG: hypothetical protein ATN34_04450 [Epulopiscium sp. Nele67-Bin002]|nr:MAG: hypothetical protein ATN33_02895 [Epulopiscium sp. Nele67-Bin001]OON91151.1 MAG: hypothetical protein ATN34_04450 [Epulopiscium sp. Nele67-Bin002]
MDRIKAKINNLFDEKLQELPSDELITRGQLQELFMGLGEIVKDDPKSNIEFYADSDLVRPKEIPTRKGIKVSRPLKKLSTNIDNVEVEDLKKQLAQTQNELESIKTILLEEQAQRVEKQYQLEEKRQQLEEKQLQLDDAKQEMGKIIEEIENYRMALEEAGARVFAVESELEGTKAQLEEANREIERKTKQIAQGQEDLANSNKKLVTAQNKLEDTKQILFMTQDELYRYQSIHSKLGDLIKLNPI